MVTSTTVPFSAPNKKDRVARRGWPEIVGIVEASVWRRRGHSGACENFDPNGEDAFVHNNLEKRDDIPHWNTCPRWFELASSLKRCLLHRITYMQSQYYWSEIASVCAECGSDLLKNVLGAKYLVNKDDVKGLLIPYPEEAECVQVTVGVGNDTFAEQRLKEYVKNVKFYGVDPILQSGEPYKKMGDYYQLAVASKPGQLNASVLINGHYTWQMVEAITLEELLINRLKLPMIDFLFLDIEGAEYKVLPQLSSTGALANKTVICQINVELHGPLPDYGMDAFMFSRVIKSLIFQSNYLPLWVPKPTSHHRFFLIDWKSPECVQKYFTHWC
uniref:Methyltransferase FkbM domain-containing protein n=1 Tax=Plectus sambesii TaxID=2011161 RepID=A0A914UXG9_9BILA